MTPEKAAGLYQTRLRPDRPGDRVESARWGDNQIDNGDRKRYTRPDWVDNYNDMLNDYFPRRTDNVIRQLERRDWFEAGIAPEFSINGTPQHGGFIDTESQLTMQALEGTIFYTMDGSDPRMEGGDVAAQALTYTTAIPLSASTTVRARLRQNDGSWSPINEARFVTSVPADASSLRISEVHYHPSDPSAAETAAGFDNANDFEFVELVNIAEYPIDLAEVRFERFTVGTDVQGLDFQFADSLIQELAPGQRVLAVEDLDAFQFRYGAGLPVAGQWNGGLGNGSERLLLLAGEQTIHDFTYEDSWYPSTDGDGPSLQIEDESGELDLWTFREGWRASFTIGGSPGTSDEFLPGDSNHDGIFNSSDMVVVFQAGEYEDGVPGNSTFEEGDWNGDGDFDSGDMVYVLQLGHYSTTARPRLAIPGPSLAADVAAAVLAETAGLPTADVPVTPAVATPLDEASGRIPASLMPPRPARTNCLTSGHKSPTRNRWPETTCHWTGSYLTCWWPAGSFPFT